MENTIQQIIEYEGKTKEEKSTNLEYYRHSPISDLKSIMTNGLNPDKAKSNLRGYISDQRQKVFYSEGKEGAITLDCNFRSKFKQTKDKQSEFYNKKAEEYETMDAFLKANDKGQERVFLKIKDMELINEQNINQEDRYADAYTSKTIPPDKIYVCVLKNPKTGDITHRREDVIKYMMSVCSVKDIKTKYQINEIQEQKLNNQYNEMKDEIQKFAEYEMVEMEIEDFYKKYVLSKEKTSTLPIAEDLKNSAEKIAKGKLARDMRGTQSEIKNGYQELKNPTQTKENNSQSFDD